MLLEELELPTRQLNILKNKGFCTAEQMLISLPKTYYDFRQPVVLSMTDTLKTDIENKKIICVVGKMLSLETDFNREKKFSITKIKLYEPISKNKLHVNIIGNYQLCQTYRKFYNKKILVGGILQYSEEYNSFSMLNPVLFSDNVDESMRIIPVYPKLKGISDEGYSNIIKQAILKVSKDDYVYPAYISKYKLLSLKFLLQAIHFPETMDEIEQAKKRLIFENLLYFSCKLEEMQKEVNCNSYYTLKMTDTVEDFIKSQSFNLTESQTNCINEMFKDSASGKRISALVQGDVGSGKTMIAFCLMLSAASLGYQSVLMAPTSVLALQHYNELSKWAVKYGYQIAFINSELKGKSKKEVLSDIKNGNYQFIIGTHSCISADVEYDNLALVITDEEHKFGVLQRDNLKQKGDTVHNITMSATPIPRTLANTIYGDNTKVYNIELPAERKKVKTACYNNQKGIFDFLEKEIKDGHQAYVVCPLIDEAESGSKMEGIKSVEEVYVQYNRHFKDCGIKVSVITGKTPKDEQMNIIDKFKHNESQILIATTVIEVGVNIPNATVIVITGAERFGLATLHQLRGRVGRSDLQSYCILQKTNPYIESVNVDIMAKETDGFVIAMEDLKNRGIGNLVGVEQSGNHKYTEMMLRYPNMYNVIKNNIAKELCSTKQGQKFIEKYEHLFGLV